MKRHAGVRLLLAASLLATGCATTRDRVILLPGAEGDIGRVAVMQNGRETLLDQAYGSVQTDDRGRAKSEQLDATVVRERYAAELATLPPRPRSWYLYFVGDSSDLTPGSRAELPAILDAIRQWPASEVSVIGHTDTRGDSAYNDQLSLQRAEAIRAEILNLGGDPQRVSAAGRGERELAIPTADETGEPRNRRVEISAR